MSTDNDNNKTNEYNAYYISFCFDVKQPGTLVTIANNEEEAREKFMNHMTNFDNVQIHEVVDIVDVPSLRRQTEESREFEQALEEFQSQMIDDNTSDDIEDPETRH